MMFAVIKTGGKQYRVAPNDLIVVERIRGQSGDPIAFDQVLMVADDKSRTIGTPLVDGATVAATVVDQGRADKILVFKKRPRGNYRRKKGHRQALTTVRITEILTGGQKPKAAAKAKPKPKLKPEPKPTAKTKTEAPPDAGPATEANDAPKAKAPARPKAEPKAKAGPKAKAPKETKEAKPKAATKPKPAGTARAPSKGGEGKEKS